MFETKIIELGSHNHPSPPISDFYKQMALCVEEGWELVKSDIVLNPNNWPETYIALFKRKKTISSEIHWG